MKAASYAGRRDRQTRALVQRDRELEYWLSVRSGEAPAHKNERTGEPLTPEQVQEKIDRAQFDCDRLEAKLRGEQSTDFIALMAGGE